MVLLAAPDPGGELMTTTSPTIHARHEPDRQGPHRRRRYVLNGVVQGVGLRPYVYSAATELGLFGTVANGSEGVIVDVEGNVAALEELERRMSEEPPPLAVIVTVTAEELQIRGGAGFSIESTTTSGRLRTLCPADVTTCADCLRELADPTDRRFRHPFVTCTNCGPRYTIITSLPYDRDATTMTDFAMCLACRREYEDPSSRRFHAQPIACHDCGPVLQLVQPGRPALIREPALDRARSALQSGQVLAVKGLGGYHLVCDAGNESAVAELRRRKGRASKPFAIMVADVAAAHEIVRMCPAEQALLTGPQRPIVLMARLPHPERDPIASSVAFGAPDLGVMLPYTPVHQLLLEAVDHQPSPRVLVMTSGNRGGHPILTDDDEALTELAGLADAWLGHGRRIVAACDDSVTRLLEGAETIVRRSRGYAPLPVVLPVDVPPMLAVGADLKSVCGVAEGRRAWLSQHIGDLGDLGTVAVFDAVQSRLQQLTGITPRLIAVDAHPDYRSVRWARQQARGRTVIKVQHHHAHVAAVMAEHGLDGTHPVIGIAFDGTGYGSSGCSGPAESWGGEVLVADYRSFHRAGHLRNVGLAGGDLSVTRPYRMALSHLLSAGLEWDDDLPCVAACPYPERSVLHHQLKTGLASTATSSMGRLFDAVASLIGVRHMVDHEAQAALELENLARDVEADTTYSFGLSHDAEGSFDAAPVIRAIVDDVRAGVHPSLISARFHLSVAELVAELCLRQRDLTGLDVVVLGGGVFQNVVLRSSTLQLLRFRGFEVLVPSRVPANDGGLALGQIMIAAHQELPCV